MSTEEGIVGLSELRAMRGLTLEAVGVLAGVDASTVNRIERGICKARPATVVRLARALGISARRLDRMLAAYYAEHNLP